MDLLSIARKLWLYKLVTIPVLLLTFAGAVYAIGVKEPVYEATSSYVLINPPAPPTAEAIARDPSLARINADNPYTRFSDQSVIVEVLASKMSSESEQQALEKAGVDARYTVARASEFGYSSPIVQITAQGSTPEAAVQSARLVGEAVVRELNAMQRSEGVDPGYLINAQQIKVPHEARLRAAGQLRTLVGVLALGALVLFVVVSIADALSTLRRERTAHPEHVAPASEGDLWGAQNGGAANLSVVEPEPWPDLMGPVNGGQPLNPLPDPDEPGRTSRGSES